jgi:tetratricopeptide (TPR) repeat protein
MKMNPICWKINLILCSCFFLSFFGLGRVALARENLVLSSDIKLLLQQAKQSYQAENYEQSVNLWQQLAEVFGNQEDSLNQGMALSNLALSYQKLGQWDLAQKVVIESLNLLENQSNTAEKKRIYAQSLDIKAQAQKNIGNLEDALATWQQSAEIYREIQGESLWSKNLINQAQTLQDLGLYNLACQTFLKSLNFQSIKCQISSQDLESIFAKSLSSEEINSLIGLANLKRLLGALTSSEQILNNLLDENQKLSTLARSQVFLNLGNTQIAIANRAKYVGDFLKYTQYNRQALTHLNTASISENLIDKTKAKINILNFFIEQQEWKKANKIVSEIMPLVDQIKSSQQGIYIKLNLVKNLVCLDLRKTPCYSYQNDGQNLAKKINQRVLATSINILNKALEESVTIDDKRSQSYTLGNLGIVYAQQGDKTLAKKYLEQALQIAQSIPADDIAYQWEWQLGRLL